MLAPPSMSSGTRWKAGGLLGGCGLLALWIAHGVATSRLEKIVTPFPAHNLRGQLPSGASWTGGSGGAEILLYVDQHCAYCKEELHAWSTSLALTSRTPAPRVVLSPRSDTQHDSYLPSRFRGMWIHDRDTVIARALALRGVPTTVVIIDNRVTAIRSGLTSAAAKDSLLQIVSVSGPAGGEL